MISTHLDSRLFSWPRPHHIVWNALVQDTFIFPKFLETCQSTVSLGIYFLAIRHYEGMPDRLCCSKIRYLHTYIYITCTDPWLFRKRQVEPSKATWKALICRPFQTTDNSRAESSMMTTVYKFIWHCCGSVGRLDITMVFSLQARLE